MTMINIEEASVTITGDKTIDVATVKTWSDMANHDHVLEDITDSGDMASQEASNVNISGGIISDTALKNYSEDIDVNSSSGTTAIIDLTNGNIHDLTLTDSCAITFANPPSIGKAGSFTLFLSQDSVGGRTVTWPISVKWPDGNIPTLSIDANAIDIVVFVTKDAGTTWYGFLSGSDMK